MLEIVVEVPTFEYELLFGAFTYNALTPLTESEAETYVDEFVYFPVEEVAAPETFTLRSKPFYTPNTRENPLRSAAIRKSGTVSCWRKVSLQKLWV